MPTAPLKICSQPGCGKRTDGRFCETHQRENHSVDSARAYDKNRREHDPFHLLYKALRWIALAARVRREEPLCRACGFRATRDVDHIVPARQWVAAHNNDMESFYDRSNLQGLCKGCHSAKTMRGE